MKSYWKPTILVSVLLLGLTSLGLSFADNGISEAQKQTLQNFDFSPAIDSLPFVERNESPEVAGRIGLKAAHAPNITSKEDEKILGARRLSDGRLMCSQDLMGSMSRYLRTNNMLPKSALDLYPELATEQGFSAFVAMDPAERLERYHEGVNLFTGRFYQSFNETTPSESGGIYVELNSPDSPAWGKDVGQNAADRIEVSKVYKLTFFGHAGEPLYSTHCGLR